MQNSTSKEYGELIALWEARRRYLSYAYKNLDEHLKNELNHEEPSWRTPVTKGWWHRMKDERIRLKPGNDLDGGSDEMAEEIELRKRKDENTWN